jgi:hypothetical protein
MWQYDGSTTAQINLCCDHGRAMSSTMKRRRIGLVLVFSLLTAGGCGSRTGIERVAVSGAATYLGQPIEVGQIRFVPIPPSVGPITVELIRDGRYETLASGGVPVGTHRVELRMYDPEEYRTAPKTAGSPAVKQLLPDKYNLKSELTLTVDRGSGPINHDFQLTE